VAIELVHYRPNQIGIDPDTAKIDIERTTAGITASHGPNISVIEELV